MVSFSHLPYADALKEYTRQDEVLSDVITWPHIGEKWDNEYLQDNRIVAESIKSPASGRAFLL